MLQYSAAPWYNHRWWSFHQGNVEIHKHLSKDTEIRDMNIIMLTFCSSCVTYTTGDLRNYAFLNNLVVDAVKDLSHN